MASTWSFGRDPPEKFRRAGLVQVLLCGDAIALNLQDSLRALIGALGCPFAAMAMDKGVLSEAHPPDWPWPISAWTPCTGMVRAPNVGDYNAAKCYPATHGGEIFCGQKDKLVLCHRLDFG
jgi:hypothetical protein